MKFSKDAPKAIRSRRDFLRCGLCGLGVSTAMPGLLSRTSAALAAEALAGGEANPERILVVIELSGGNDGLNTIVPYANDEYYRVRPTLGIAKKRLLKVSDEYGFHPSLTGLEELFKEGRLAVVHGCGYPNPSLSHFTSMGFWHTGAPNAGERLGWVGRLADVACPEDRRNLIVNIGRSQSLAVKSRVHSPLVFSDPERFKRKIAYEQSRAFEQIGKRGETTNATLDFLNGTAENAAESAEFVREAWRGYRTPIDYGVAGMAGDLRKVTALIDSGMPTRFYYVSYSGNSFDTHVHQADLHTRLLMYTSDALRGFQKDLERIGRAGDVASVVFTEFGRRVEENTSRGTDHGTATPMFIFGQGVKGGFYGRHPSLTDLDDGNLKMTTDFRRVYATMIEEWIGYGDTKTLLKGDYPTLGAFA